MGVKCPRSSIYLFFYILKFVFIHSIQAPNCNGGPYPVPASTAIRTAYTPILPYLDSLVIVTIILKRYLEHCRFCLGIMLLDYWFYWIPSPITSPVVVFLNPMTLNHGTVESNGFSTIFLFQVILFLSRGMLARPASIIMISSVLLEPLLFY